MPLNRGTIARYLRERRFTDLFIEELGWDEARTPPLDVQVDGQTYLLRPIAQKRGLIALVELPTFGKLATLPPYALRRKIETQVARRYREHLIVFGDDAGEAQVWQWVRRESGQPLQSREHAFYRGQSGEALIQKLETLRFSLEQEDDLSLVDVVGQVRAAFNVERATRKFFQEFKREHDAFQKFLQGIPDADLQSWYVSVMLNRLMFIYFIQKKGFLDGDADYLRHKLEASERTAPDRYYHDLLCPLFFEGFAKPEGQRDPELAGRLGRAPYLNGGIFQRHQVEQLYGATIAIPDRAFRQVFDFFDRYQWHLDDRPLRDDREINPDVLGYIFEQYINQKEMGAYYTKEDITEYIGKNTILPFLCDRARELHPAAFRGDNAVWTLLQADPDRYIYDALRKGVELPLPAEIEAGVGDVSQRGPWNTPAAEGYALPTEIWRETVARRQRYEEIWLKLAGGEVGQVNDLITLNLDIRQFVQDVIERTEDPDLVRAFWRAATSVTVLDPTAGSGAFLFAALNILRPIYEACLDRMAQLVAELPASAPAQTYRDFRETLADVGRHPNRAYFILKRIMVNNLYGVDIMAEATEIAKLRLFLKLVALVEDVARLEPLPDIDFNIRAGNTLVGFAGLAQVEKVVRGDRLLLLPEDEALLAETKEEAEHVDRLFGRFRQMQTAHDVREWSEDFVAAKAELRRRLAVLNDRLNRLLALQYGVEPARQPAAYDAWLRSHQPFHWCVEFYGIMARGGFDVVIGNPPYVEYSTIRDVYEPSNRSLLKTGNLYSLCTEKSLDLVTPNGYVGIIVPISSISTPRMKSLMKLLVKQSCFLSISSFAVRPDKLFIGADMNLTILLLRRGQPKTNAVFCTRYNRWYTSGRPYLFQTLVYAKSRYFETDQSAAIPKIGSSTEMHILDKAVAFRGVEKLEAHLSVGDTIYYHSGGRYYRKAIRDRLSNEYKPLTLKKGWGDVLICLLSSSLYYLIWIITSDTYHVTQGDIRLLTVPESLENDQRLTGLATRLLADMWAQAERRTRTRAHGTQQEEVNFRVGKSKRIIDAIDRVLAQHYGFTAEELDFIINYDIKYRMGDALVEDGDGG